MVAFKFEARPNEQQVKAFTSMVGASRFAFNTFLSISQARASRYQALRDELIALAVYVGNEPPSEAELAATGEEQEKLQKKREAKNWKAKLESVRPELRRRVREVREDPSSTEDDFMHPLTSFGMQSDWLTPQIAFHRQLAREGKQYETTWVDRDGVEHSEMRDPWMHTVPRRAFVDGLDRAQRAYQNFYDSITGKRAGERAGQPKFKRAKDRRGSFTFPTQGASVTIAGYTTKGDGGPSGEMQRYSRILFGTKLIGNMRIETSRKNKGRSTKRLSKLLARDPRNTITSFTVTQDGDQWFLSLLVRDFSPAPQTTKRQKENGVVGVSLGVQTLATLSNGRKYEAPKTQEKLDRDIKFYQRKLARQERGSNRYEITRKKLRELNAKTALNRGFVQGQLTKDLATEFETIVVADYDVKAMSKSAKGTVENPGENVAVQAEFNRLLLDKGFGEIQRQLGYKTKFYGSNLIVVPAEYTTMTCSECGERGEVNLTQKLFTCQFCGFQIDRKQGAAINIKQLGLKMQKDAV